LKFGKNVHLSQNVSIECHKSISFGSNTTVGFDTMFMDSDHHFIIDLREGIETTKNNTLPILIGEHNWICARCIIMKGLETSKNCIISAGTVIGNKKINENVLVGNGFIKENKNWRV